MPTLDPTGLRSFPSARAMRVLGVLGVLAVGACTNNVEEPHKSTVKSGTPPIPSATQKTDGGRATPQGADGGAQFPLGPLPDDAPFEGNIALRVAEVGVESARATFTFLVKGKKLRWDIVGGGGAGSVIGYRIYDGEKKKFFSVLTDEPSVFVTDAHRLVGDGGGTFLYKLTPLAAEPKGAVMGLPCDRLITTDDHLRYDVCLTSAIPTLPFALLGGPMSTAIPFSSQLDQQGAFPLSVSSRPLTAAGQPIAGSPRGSLKLTKLERGRVPNAAFELPAYPSVASMQLPPVRKLR